MSPDKKLTDRKSLRERHKAFTKERTAFKTLLLANPNYFGTLEDFPLEPVVPISGNTYYEELACLGYHPQHEQLEGVVYVYNPTGYGTDICGPGTPEYVRFYLSFDNGATWQDQGMTSFQAFNIPEGTDGSKFLEYAVSLKVDPPRKFCFFQNVIRARAILSWNDPPPANQPNWPPVWGNALEVPILVEPRRLFHLPELFEAAELEFPELLDQVIDPLKPLESETKSLTAAELAVKYKKADVPVHRFALKEIKSFVSAQSDLSAATFKTLLPDIEINPEIFDLIYPKADGDTSYEELHCIGLDPNAPDTLVGVIQVKKSAGYSGGPCTDGSREYVTFWADFDDNGSFETCLGTASVRVYDLNDIPDEGIYYAVRLPVDLSDYRQRCRLGPRNVRIRAILSWNVAAPCANPNHVPTWGNREETLINIPPVAGAPAGKIAILGGIPTSLIDDITGLTSPGAFFATNNLPVPLGCSFGGRVTVQGAPLIGHSYRVEVTPAGGGAPMNVVTNLLLTRQNGTTHVHTADPVTKRFDYLPFNENVNGVLAQWDSSGEELWIVKLYTYGPGGVPLGSPDTHLIQLDNKWPDASITITTGTGDCGKFPAGTVIQGKFVARDANLLRYGLSVIPNVNPPGVGVPAPPNGTVNTAPAPGDNWQLDTTGMKSCGYVLHLVAVDRVIVNSQSIGHHSPANVGFCIT